MIAILGSATLLIGLGVLAFAEAQPQAAIGVVLFVGGASVLAAQISKQEAIADARDAQEEALEDARDAEIKATLEFAAGRDLEREAELMHAANLRYWWQRHGWKLEANR